MHEDASRDGVRGGTLRVLSEHDIDGLDTAVAYTPQSFAIGRTYARTLYGYDLNGPRERRTDPVPDIASGPPQLSADQRTYTFRLRAGVIETSNGPYFIKLTGPAETITKWDKAFEQFVASLKYA